MSLSTEARHYMAMRDELDFCEKSVIDETFKNLYADSVDYGVAAATDDRAAELEAALIKFIISSREK